MLSTWARYAVGVTWGASVCMVPRVAMGQVESARERPSLRLALIGAVPSESLPNDALFNYSPGLGGRIELERGIQRGRVAIRAAGDLVRFDGNSGASIRTWTAQAGAAIYSSARGAIMPYVLASMGIALNAIDNCGLITPAGGGASGDCSTTRSNLAASAGIGARQSRGPLFTELRYSANGAHLGSVNVAVGVAF